MQLPSSELVWLTMGSFHSFKMSVHTSNVQVKNRKAILRELCGKVYQLNCSIIRESRFWNFVSLNKFASGSISSSRRTIFVEKRLTFIFFIFFRFWRFSFVSFMKDLIQKFQISLSYLVIIGNVIWKFSFSSNHLIVEKHCIFTFIS